mgnify:CR=1 FL=1
MMDGTARSLLWIAGPLLVLGASAESARAGDDPPPGPPWVRSYRAAQAEALKAQRPIFVYFTKTY